MKIGYCRVSTDDQNPDLQLAALKRAGCKRIFTDKASGAHVTRPELVKCLKALNASDTLIVWKLDRLGRLLRDLIGLLDDLKARGVAFRSLTESIDTATPTGRAMWQMVGILAELERSLIQERTKAGRAAAVARGVKLGRKPKLSPQQVAHARKLLDQGERPAHVAQLLKSPQQLDRHLERRERTIVCPRCATCCSRVKESRTRGIRDLPMLERPVMLWLPLRRFGRRACPHRPWKTRETFGERVQWTERLYHQVREDCLRGCPSRVLARRSGLSARTVCRWTCERSRGGRPRTLGRVIGIDAYARRKGHRDNTLIVDVEQGQPLATLKGRRAEDGIAWFHSRPQDERDQVDVVVLEMSKTYFAAMQEVFGDRVHVIDRLHVVKQAVEALDAVWRSVQHQLDPDDAKALKKLRTRWLKSADQRNVDELIARDEWRRRFPQRRETLDWVQDVRQWFDRQYDKPAREALVKLIERAGQSAQEPLQRIAGTLSRWCDPILRYIRHRYTNGMTEGFNNTIKLVQRMAYSLRHAHKRQKRILAWCGKT